jgi:hypothetical protein
VENWWIGSDIPFPWASKWRDDLARGRFPRGLPAQGKGRVPGGIPGFQTSPKGSNRIIPDSALLEMRGHQNAKRTMHVLVHCAFAPYFWWMSTSQKKKLLVDEERRDKI